MSDAPTGPIPIVADEHERPPLAAVPQSDDGVKVAAAGFALAALLTFFVAPRVLTVVPLGLAAFGIIGGAAVTLRGTAGATIALGVVSSLLSIGVVVACLIADAQASEVPVIPFFS